ncbi:MAG TPA: 1,4-dihydroxy-6-naphthoate synthase [Lacibacter sp.]|nr:1,4-dihydroxy-6-naphthoate synthase [Lacibacter sp.]HMO87584.1 1,4-dihydroxy-6-naphthoate synthase [Lacibacter sp.]HMP87509.1 1,4-dihydroxy-6-naphthoate synthase [Lacibacter sp.]
MKLRIGFSPCPNDTFIFDALVNGPLDAEGIEWEVHLEDVQTLNEWALEGKLDVTKISFGVWPLLQGDYHLLQSGGALGKGVGPLLIAKSKPGNTSLSALRDFVRNATIAIPGQHTTAHFLFSRAFPDAPYKQFRVFHEIENTVVQGEADAGVIIHENRFTYHQKGLHLLLDLGAFWEEQTGLPIPLGGIVAHKRIGAETAARVDRLIRQSLEQALTNYPNLPPFVREHAQEMEESVMRQHIELYVNDCSLGMGTEGQQAVEEMLKIFQKG